MSGVHLRPVARANLTACLALRVGESHSSFVASNAQSLAGADVDSALVPLTVYSDAARG